MDWTSRTINHYLHHHPGKRVEDMKAPIGTIIFCCYITAVSTWGLTAACMRPAVSHRPKPDVEAHVNRTDDGWTNVQVYIDCPRGFIYDDTDVESSSLLSLRAPGALISEIEEKAICRKETWSDKYAMKFEEERWIFLGWKVFSSDVVFAHQSETTWRYK